MTFTEFQTYAQELYKSLREEAERASSEKHSIRNTYSAAIALEMCADVDEGLKDFVAKQAGIFEAKVQDFIKQKRAELNKMLVAAPTAEQLSILNALQFRGDQITESECLNLAAEFASNYQASQALRAHAKKYNIHIPGAHDFDERNKNLAWIESYLTARVNDLRTFTGHKPGALSNLFFVEGYHDPHYEEHVEAFA